MNKLLAASLVSSALALLTASCQAHTPRGSQSGPPLFTPAQGSPLKIGSNPNEIAAGDWNKDGRLDIVTCNADDTVTVLLGDGRGGFAPAPGEPMKVAAHLVAAGDVNNDGKIDLALTHHDSFGVIVLLGSGDGRFAPAPGSPFAAHQGTKAHNHGLTFSDLNSDGNLDITTSNQDDNSVSVLLGDGRGGFAPAAGSPFPVGRAPYPHAVSDVNGDGRPDIITPDVGSGTVSVLLGDGRGGFTAAAKSPYAVASRPYYVAVGDVNGDGSRDVITTHDDISLVTTLLGDGRGGFAPAPHSPFDLGRQPYEIAAADINGDARMDLIVGAAGNNSLNVLLSDERGGYTHAGGSPYAAGGNPRAVTGDVNGDGKLDLITASNESADINVWLGVKAAAGR
ncbi:MAG TPA: VCBS repeat-containing protein [Pyrinomonadaceae bacterium]|nr:VCBS repeat-containing protein [Pyrinomonadaceae bacterium]